MALDGVRVLEIAGLAPAPFCGMVLADFGAEVIRIDRVGGGRRDFMSRGKKSIQVDLKSFEGKQIVLDLCERADVIIEPFRPGVMEKLELGPKECQGRNDGLIYARLTGFGQSGKYADRAGHDNNYLAISGVLGALGRAKHRPHPPQNLLADFAGGGLMCALGIMMALFEKTKSGKGQVIDAAMVDGSAYLASMSYVARGVLYGQPRGTNMLDGGAPFYDVYQCSDKRYVAVGAIEPQFYSKLLGGLNIPEDDDLWTNQLNTSMWPKQKRQIAAKFKSKPQSAWLKIFGETDACVTPVLKWDDLETNEHTGPKGRNLVVDVGGEKQIRPAPVLSRTPGVAEGKEEPEVGANTREVLSGFLSKQVIDDLALKGIIAGEGLQNSKL